MRHTIPFLFIGFLMIMLLSCQDEPPEKPPQSQDESFEAYKDSFINMLWEFNPSWASYEGLSQYDSIQSLPTESNRKAQIEAYRAALEKLKQFELDRLSPNNQTDLHLMRNELGSSIWYQTTFKSYEWNPSTYNPAGSIYRILGLKDQSLEQRLRSINARLKKIPAYFEAAKENIKKPTREHTDLAILRNKGAISVYRRLIPDSTASSNLSEELKREIRQNNRAARAAQEAFIAYLEDEVLANLGADARSFRIGRELYEDKFQYDLESRYTAEEIVGKAIENKTKLHQEMSKLSRELWEKYLKDSPQPEDSLQMIRMVIDEIAKKHVHRDSFVTAIRGQILELEDFVRSKDLLYLDPKKPLVVRETPMHMRGGGAGASVSAPGPYDKDGNTYYNVTPLNEYSPEGAESYLREYNDYMLQILNIHEAVPGHYTQLVYSNQSPSLIKSIVGNGAMIEGWAVYTERMMLEEGYGNDSPELWLMYYKWNLRSTINTILDYGVHVGEMTEKEALNLLMKEGFQEEQEAKNKWKRATLSQVQLCSYFTGFREIYDFREEYKEKLGDDFNLKLFHEDFLGYGSAPVKYIREMMLED